MKLQGVRTESTNIDIPFHFFLHRFCHVSQRVSRPLHLVQKTYYHLKSKDITFTIVDLEYEIFQKSKCNEREDSFSASQSVECVCDRLTQLRKGQGSPDRKEGCSPFSFLFPSLGAP